jgi:hypothetical protein
MKTFVFKGGKARLKRPEDDPDFLARQVAEQIKQAEEAARRYRTPLEAFPGLRGSNGTGPSFRDYLPGEVFTWNKIAGPTT